MTYVVRESNGARLKSGWGEIAANFCTAALARELRSISGIGEQG